MLYPSTYQMLTRQILLYVSFLLLASYAQAVILYSGVNSANLTAPDAERTDIFNAVARIHNPGGATGSGGAVYLGGKYLLTANHVGLYNNLTFDGSIYWEIDKDFGTNGSLQIASQDIKLIKLKEIPTGVTAVTLNTTSSVTNKTGTLVGWGYGRSTSDTDGNDIWNWGNQATEAKRWGTNKISQTTTLTYSDNKGNTYTNISLLITRLNNNAGSDEAALAYLDSGGGLFAKFGNQWRLTGLTAVAGQTSGASTSSFDNNTDFNGFVRISTYASAIEAAIPDTDTYGGWQTDHSLYGNDALADADTDGDGIGQLHEFAFGGDPNDNDLSILPTNELTEDGGSTYLEITLTRPKDLQVITYTPQTTADLSSWPTDSTGIVTDTPTPVDNGDGTETLTFRRSQAVAGADQAFIRIDVSE